MTGIRLKPGEAIEIAVRKLKKLVDRCGILKKKKSLRYYTKPSLEKKEKKKELSKRKR